MNINTPKYLILHHSGGADVNPLQDTSNQTFEDIEAYHKIRFNFQSSLGFWSGYQYVIDKAGVLHQARLDTEEGAHTIGHNNDSIGICLIGNFDATMPSEAQIETLKGLLISKVEQYGISVLNIVPHRTFAVKTCYGNNLSDDWGRTLIAGYIQQKKDIITQLILAYSWLVDLYRKQISALTKPTGSVQDREAD